MRRRSLPARVQTGESDADGYADDEDAGHFAGLRHDEAVQRQRNRNQEIDDERHWRGTLTLPTQPRAMRPFRKHQVSTEDSDDCGGDAAER